MNKHPGKSDRRGEQRQRRLDQRNIVAEFQHQRPDEGQQAQAPECEADLAEELHRPIERAIDEVKSDQVEKDPGNSAEAHIWICHAAGHGG